MSNRPFVAVCNVASLIQSVDLNKILRFGPIFCVSPCEPLSGFIYSFSLFVFPLVPIAPPLASLSNTFNCVSVFHVLVT